MDATCISNFTKSANLAKGTPLIVDCMLFLKKFIPWVECTYIVQVNVTGMLVGIKSVMITAGKPSNLRSSSWHDSKILRICHWMIASILQHTFWVDFQLMLQLLAQVFFENIQIAGVHLDVYIWLCLCLWWTQTLTSASRFCFRCHIAELLLTFHRYPLWFYSVLAAVVACRNRHFVSSCSWNTMDST